MPGVGTRSRSSGGAAGAERFSSGGLSCPEGRCKKGGFLKTPFIIAEGHVIYGTCYSLDDVQAGAGGETAKISCLYAPHSVLPVSDTTISRMTGKLVIDFTFAEGGEETAFIFRDKSLSLKPGDTILKD